MSNLATLKKYLIDSDKAFLTDPNNNGKIVMLSGAWGSGKTHFWQNKIEPQLREKLKENIKSYVYISLYGKTNIDSVKQEIYYKSHNEQVEESKYISKEMTAFGVDTFTKLSTAFGKAGQSVAEIATGILDSYKTGSGAVNLLNGGVICLDDFERKSKNIDLNDLFGFIHQIAYELNCIVVIILNDDVFENKEALIFERVKEKTINKFFYFEPSINELYDSVFSDNKYKDIEEYKNIILDAIVDSKQLNARIYNQVLDNCLEWIKKDKDSSFIYLLSLFTINFILNHIIIGFPEIYDKYNSSNTIEFVDMDDIIVSFPENEDPFIDDGFYSLAIEYANAGNSFEQCYLRHKKDRTKGENSVREQEYLIYLESKKHKLSALYNYCYIYFDKLFLKEKKYLERDTYIEMNNFIKTGVLI